MREYRHGRKEEGAERTAEPMIVVVGLGLKN